MTYHSKTMIVVRGIILEATLCPFGCRIYPASSLAMHIAAHERLGKMVLAPVGWMHNRPGKTHVSNRLGRPRKKDSEKTSTAIIKHHNRGRR